MDDFDLLESVRRRDYLAIVSGLDARLRSLGNDDLHTSHKAHLLISRAHCEQQLGLFRKALKSTEEALTLLPYSVEALLLRAKVFVSLRRMEDAKETLETMMNLPKSFEACLRSLSEAIDLLDHLKSGNVEAGFRFPLTSPYRVTASVGRWEKVNSELSQRMRKCDLNKNEALVSHTEDTNTRSADNSQNVGTCVGVDPEKQRTVSSADPVTCVTSSKGSDNGKHVNLSIRSAERSNLADLDPMQRLTAITDPKSAVAIAVDMVNCGQHGDAAALMDIVLEKHGRENVAALATRGTALALLGRLEQAVNDFNSAISIQPNYADFYKRRAQALSALDRDDDALDDLEQAMKLVSSEMQTVGQDYGVRSVDQSALHHSKVEILSDMARIHQKRRDYRRAQSSASEALLLRPEKAETLLSVLGSAEISQGNLREGIVAFEQIIAKNPENADAFLNLGMALKESSRVDDAVRALEHAALLGNGSSTEINAYRLLAQLRQGLGNHLLAVEDLDRALAVPGKSDAQEIELRFLRGAFHHAVGMYRQAVEDYQLTLDAQKSSEMSRETIGYLCAAFYQREIVLWTVSRLDEPMADLCLDADLLPEFKELWCKKCPPSSTFAVKYGNMMRSRRIAWNVPQDVHRSRFNAMKRELKDLLQVADNVGSKVQYRHQGFLPNRRQHRMAGLAAIEFAQLLRRATESRRYGNWVHVSDLGASVCARGPSGIGGGGRGSKGSTHPLGWRDAMEIIVKWRQISEPNDQVLWVDLLTKEEFSAGFGSHTPMFTGQTKCVRYYMNFERALKVAKSMILKQGYVCDADNKHVAIGTQEQRLALGSADSAMSLWNVVGQDFWVVVPINSSVRPGHVMEGTRLTCVSQSGVKKDIHRRMRYVGHTKPDISTEESLQGKEERSCQRGTITQEMERSRDATDDAFLNTKFIDTEKQQPDAYEFSIRTPVTPARWKDYDTEMSTLFESLIDALADEDQERATDTALRFAFYWYNFMPLARGSALCGYVSLLGALLAMGQQLPVAIPQDYQTDWEAILESSPEAFIRSVTRWMLTSPDASSHEGNEAQDGLYVSVEDLPQVSEVLITMRERIMALNGFQDPVVG